MRVNVNVKIESELENIILVSSVNKVGLDILFIEYGKSFMYNRKNSRPSIEPCGTSCLTLSQSELFLEYSCHWIGSWVGPGASLDISENRKNLLPLSRIEGICWLQPS